MQAPVALLEALIAAIPYRIHTVLTDTASSSPDLPKNRTGPTARFHGHAFDGICRSHEPHHQRKPPRSVIKTTATTNCVLISAISSLPYDFAKRLRTLQGLTAYEFHLQVLAKNIQTDLLLTTSIKCRN